MPFKTCDSKLRPKSPSSSRPVPAIGSSRVLILTGLLAISALGVIAGFVFSHKSDTPGHSSSGPATTPGTTIYRPDPWTTNTARYKIKDRPVNDSRNEPPHFREDSPHTWASPAPDVPGRPEFSGLEPDSGTRSKPEAGHESAAVRSLRFERGPDGVESVFIQADGPLEPVVFPLEGKNPFGSQVRLVLDLKGVSSVEGSVYDSEPNGYLITRIRTSYRPDALTFRVVLDIADDVPFDFIEELSPDGRFVVHVSGKETEKKDAPGQDLKIQRVALSSGNDDGSDLLVIQADRRFEPLVFGLEGANPYGEHNRIVLDITGVEKPSFKSDLIAGEGRVIKGVRHHYYTDERKLRLVLDLAPASEYSVSQTFHAHQNIYALSLTDEGHPSPATRSASAGPTLEKSPPEIRTPGPQEDSVLRASPADLTGRQVRAALVRHGFYSTCGIYNADYCNPDGDYFNRFIDCEEGFVCDEATGLMWEKGGSEEAMTWDETAGYIADLNHLGVAGYVDWRLPTIEELLSLMESSWKNSGLFIDGRFDANPKIFWSVDTGGTGKAWKANFHLGYVLNSLVEERNWVRAVRTLEPISRKSLEPAG